MPEQTTSTNADSSGAAGSSNNTSSRNGQPQQSAGPGAANRTALPLSTRISKMVLSLQFLWFAGHLITFLHAVYYIFVGSAYSDRSYYKAYYGALISYLIVIFKGQRNFSISKQWLTSVMMDENAQYLLLAFVWMTSGPVWGEFLCFLLLFVTQVTYL